MGANTKIDYLTELRISETDDFEVIKIKARIVGVSKWKELTGDVKVETKFKDNSFEVKVVYDGRTYAFEENGKQLYKPIEKSKCTWKVREDRVKVYLRKKDAVTWRSGAGGNGPIQLLSSPT